MQITHVFASILLVGKVPVRLAPGGGRWEWSDCKLAREKFVGIFYNHGCGGGFTDVYTCQSSACRVPKVGVLYYLEIIP